MQPTLHIDDFGPLPVYRPQSVAELGDLVRHADAEGQAVYPLGGRTMLDLGLPPTKPGIALDLTGLDQVIDYPARDMTITVQAGITIAKLQEKLAAENQRLPIDVPQPDRATLGGAIATNASGPRRYGHGTLRDYVIGITVVNDEGQEVKAGGRVVKNVAGYDLCKLYTGSLGTLGVITQVTLKLRPRLETDALVLFGCPGEQLGEQLDKLHKSATRPVCLDVRRPGFFGDYQIAVGFEGSMETVQWQVRTLRREMRLPDHTAPVTSYVGAGMTTVSQPVPMRELLVHWEDAEKLLQPEPERTLRRVYPVHFKANLLPSAVASFLRTLHALPAKAAVHAHAGNGVVVGRLTGDLTLDHTRTMLTTLLDAAGAEGNVVLLRCPPAWKAELPVWGRPRGDAWLMRAVKEKMDPRRLFNPGRFVDGI